jgi:hypothetical protein
MQQEEVSEEPKEKKKELTYEERLKAAGLTIEKARVIRDNMLFHHYHEETYKVANKLPVVLRTRDYGDAQRAMKRLEAEAPQYAVSISDLVAHCNMAASLSKYGDKSFKLYTPADDASDDEIETAFEERARFLTKVPTQIMDALLRLAGEFDEMIAAVFSTGAPEDF